MDDICTPTVPSGPTSGQRAVNGVGKDELSLMDLIAEKTRVEDELTVLGSVLDSVRYVLYQASLKILAAELSFSSAAWRQYEHHLNNLRWLPTR